MRIKDIISEDFVNYKVPSMEILFPYCTFKCNRDAGRCVCQNEHMTNQCTIEISATKVVEMFMENDITKAIVCAGLEPMDSFDDLIEMISELRKVSDYDVVVYTGYNANEIEDKLHELRKYKNIVVKFGRFVPNDESRFDDTLGITLASKNQYAERIS